MRILHVITRMVHGGAQLNTLMCCLEQARRGHRVTLATGPEAGPEGSLLERARCPEFRLVEIPSLVRRVDPMRDLSAFLTLYRLIGEGYDVVHSHTSKAGILTRWAAWARRVPVLIHTPHGHIFHSYFHPLAARIFIFLERVTARLENCQIMLSDGDLADHVAMRIAPREHFRVIPSGVPLEEFYPGPGDRASLGLPPEKALVGTVLRLVPVKGAGDLIQAWRQVQDEFPESHLAIAGDGPDRAELERQVRQLGLARTVTFLGHVQPVGEFLRVLDLFVLPSRNEGMGRAAVEAMATGLPLVVTGVGGLPNLVEDRVNGRVVPPRDPPALAAALLDLLRQPEQRGPMGQISRLRAPAFSAQVMFDGLESLYRELAGPACARRRAHPQKYPDAPPGGGPPPGPG